MTEETAVYRDGFRAAMRAFGVGTPFVKVLSMPEVNRARNLLEGLGTLVDREAIVTPAPWPDDLTPKIPAGSQRCLVEGRPVAESVRVLSEGNYQHALRCVRVVEAIDVALGIGGRA